MKFNTEKTKQKEYFTLVISEWLVWRNVPFYAIVFLAFDFKFQLLRPVWAFFAETMAHCAAG